MTAASNMHIHIAKPAIHQQSYLGNEVMGNMEKLVGRLMACLVGNRIICMKYKELRDIVFHISNGFLIEYLYKGYKRYNVTPVTPIRVLYTRTRAR